MKIESNDNIPLGFRLRHVLQRNKKIYRVVWSPDGKILASSSSDDTIRLWDIETGELLQTFTSSLVLSVAWSPDQEIVAFGGFQSFILWDVNTGKLHRMPELLYTPVYSMAWSPDGATIALGSSNGSIRLWNVAAKQFSWDHIGHSDDVHCAAWSKKDRLLATGSNDKSVLVWNVDNGSGQLLLKFTGHSHAVLDLAWSSDGQTLASSSADRTIRLWDLKLGRQINILEGHTDAVTSISFSSDDSLLASKSLDGTVRLWRRDSWETVAVLEESPNVTSKWAGGLAFHPQNPILVTLGQEDSIVRIWELDFATILDTSPSIPSVHYANAKVVLVGDSGVGKSGLGLVLAGQQFVPTESTHGRHIWSFDSQEIELVGKRKETRETLLWDLAGQPGYRLIHQLYLNEVAVALIVFDAHSETDPFAGVRHWERALRLAQRTQISNTTVMKKFLVAARTDRGGKSVSLTRIDSLALELGFDGYFESSAKEGHNIANLAESIRKAIDWETLPKVSSSDLFQRIKAFLLAEKELGRLLSKRDDLYQAFLHSENAQQETADLQAQFETCIGRVESRGLIRRLNFGNLILLQPELLDAYASALINTVKDEPDGLGSISEERVKMGDFFMPKDQRLKDGEQERLLLIAMIDDLLRHEIALRESADEGSYLVFPSQSTRENSDLSDPEGREVVLAFEGPVLNVYATLVVRLSHSGAFEKVELWKNAVIYEAKAGGMCGVLLRNIGEGRGELTLFFDKGASSKTRFLFEAFTQLHLQRRALQESIQRRSIIICPECAIPFTDLQIQSRRDRGYVAIRCSVCDYEVSLSRKDPLSAEGLSRISAINEVADTRRELERAVSIIHGKIETGDFDVFLCHDNRDKPEVRKIGEQLKDLGILPWLDEWELRPGFPWQRLLEQQIGQIKSAAVLVGKHGVGPWQFEELEAFLREFTKRGCPVIPVLLPNAPQEPNLPLFLGNRTWVDFRRQDPNPMEQLLWGITGERSLVDSPIK